MKIQGEQQDMSSAARAVIRAAGAIREGIE